MRTRAEDLYDHYVSHFRSPVVVTKFQLDELPHAIQVLGFDRVYPGCRVHASFGLSHYAEQVGHTAEVYVPLEGYASDFPAVLAASLFRMVAHHVVIDHGVAIPFDDTHAAFSAATGKSSLYLSVPYALPDTFASVRFSSGGGAHVFLGFLLSPEESRYLHDRGSDELEAVLGKAGIDPFVAGRPSVL